MIGKNFNFAETFSFLEVKTRRAFVWPSTMADCVDVLMTTVCDNETTQRRSCYFRLSVEWRASAMNQHTITITNIPTFLYSRFFFNVIIMMMAVLLYILEKKTHTYNQGR